MASQSLDVSQINEASPLRLSIAATLAFPDGSMSASGLRREALRGNLVIERIAGKDYTTLENIKGMREKCRVEVKVPDYGGERNVARAGDYSSAEHGSLLTKANMLPRDALLAKIKKRRNS